MGVSFGKHCYLNALVFGIHNLRWEARHKDFILSFFSHEYSPHHTRPAQTSSFSKVLFSKNDLIFLAVWHLIDLSQRIYDINQVVISIIFLEFVAVNDPSVTYFQPYVETTTIVVGIVGSGDVC